LLESKSAEKSRLFPNSRLWLQKGLMMYMPGVHCKHSRLLQWFSAYLSGSCDQFCRMKSVKEAPREEVRLMLLTTLSLHRLVNVLLELVHVGLRVLDLLPEGLESGV
jgi:hypothetical protein